MSEQENNESYFEDYSKENEDFMQNPKDFSDTVAKYKRNRALKITGIVLGFIAVFALVAVGVVFLLNKSTSSNDDNEPTQNTSSAPVKHEANNIDKDKPLLQGFKNAPAANRSAVQTTISNGGIKTTANQYFTINGIKLNNSSGDCVLRAPTDFCLAGSGKNKVNDIDVYYVKDAVHSRLFEKPQNFKTVKVLNSPSAGLMKINLGQNYVDALVVTNNDSSGWMILSNKGSMDSNFIHNIKIS